MSIEGAPRAIQRDRPPNLGCLWIGVLTVVVPACGIGLIRNLIGDLNKSTPDPWLTQPTPTVTATTPDNFAPEAQSPTIQPSSLPATPVPKDANCVKIGDWVQDQKGNIVTIGTTWSALIELARRQEIPFDPESQGLVSYDPEGESPPVKKSINEAIDTMQRVYNGDTFCSLPLP